MRAVPPAPQDTESRDGRPRQKSHVPVAPYRRPILGARRASPSDCSTRPRTWLGSVRPHHRGGTRQTAHYNVLYAHDPTNRGTADRRGAQPIATSRSYFPCVKTV
ncbi:hypothetical protein EXIGLDRAFT_131523 [Exidia glandulosa HHB12029]|uniref:Uncharacterized protein n=1 Tax=Exidia glandulosa HHB12029 TaxID=1314781 RepID=A0A165G3A8_EXIGL|nr:hypothetical protein EXIGLDRAFT_131523 [Exidia glandulosa HHB12029]